ncbi:MAG: hypothetical protein LM589_02405 [Thermosphaera sp.]|nr:hypothetical protein [Thermosphaera sp.]
MNTSSSGKVLNPKPSILVKLILYIGLVVFYVYGLAWCLLRRNSVRSTEDVLRVFYYDFLRLRREHVVVEKLTSSELVTVSINPCPILRLSLLLGVDTRYSCRLISETVCRRVLKCLNQDLVFARDYNYIRPYSSGCRERIYFAGTRSPKQV